MRVEYPKREAVPVLTKKIKTMNKTTYQKESLTTRQATFVLIIICIIGMLAGSCSPRYVVQSNNGECGAWYPKKCKIGTKNW